MLQVLRAARVAPGATLIRQGDPGDDMYLVLAGRVAVQVVMPNGQPTQVDTIEAGGVVGEMALLTGQPRTASVVALDDVEVACLSRHDFEGLATRHPEALNLFLHRVLPRLRRTQLVGVLTELFGALAPDAQADLEAQLEWHEIGGRRDAVPPGRCRRRRVHRGQRAAARDGGRRRACRTASAWWRRPGAARPWARSAC